MKTGLRKAWWKKPWIAKAVHSPKKNEAMPPKGDGVPANLSCP